MTGTLTLPNSMMISLSYLGMNNKMDELQTKITTAINNPTDSLDFLSLSQKWANYSLETYRDELLTKALLLSKALAEFDCELRHPSK